MNPYEKKSENIHQSFKVGSICTVIGSGSALVLPMIHLRVRKTARHKSL